MGNSFSVPSYTREGTDLTKIVKDLFKSVPAADLNNLPPVAKPNKAKAFFDLGSWKDELTRGDYYRHFFSTLRNFLYEVQDARTSPINVVEVNSGATPFIPTSAVERSNTRDWWYFAGMRYVASDLFPTGNPGVRTEPAHKTVETHDGPIDVVISIKPPPNLEFGPDLAAAYAMTQKPDQRGPHYFVCYGEMGGAEGSTDFWAWMKAFGYEVEKSVAIHNNGWAEKPCWKCLHIFKHE